MSKNDDNNNNLPVQPEVEPSPVESGGQPDNGGKKDRSNLHQRLITAIFIAVLYIAPILLGFYVNELFYDALIVFLMCAASYEFSRAVSVKFAKPINSFVFINIVLGYVAFKLSFELLGMGGVTSFFGVMAVAFIACIVYNMVSNKYNINNVVSTLFVMIYPGAIMSYLIALNYLGPFTHVAIIMAFGVTTLTDSMAYFVGSTVKGPKLCPKISPKKTISGAIGGLVGGVIGGVIIYFFAKYGVVGCEPILTATVPNVLNFLFLGLGTSLFCQIGDLISSYIKRACGIKDFGKILKGHGGFMDRIDGLIISSVFIFIYFSIAGLLV